MWALSGQSYNFTARARQDVTIHYLPMEAVQAFAENEPVLESRLMIAEEQL